MRHVKIGKSLLGTTCKTTCKTRSDDWPATNSPAAGAFGGWICMQRGGDVDRRTARRRLLNPYTGADSGTAQPAIAVWAECCLLTSTLLLAGAWWRKKL